jgi:ribonuclease HI
MPINITIYTDGAARGNPGPSASGFVAFDSNEKRIAKEWVYNDIGTNNNAEYAAVLLALKWCLNVFSSPESVQISLFSDSELVVRQLNSEYKTKSKAMKGKKSEVLALVKKFGSVRFANVPRENAGIREVDKYLNAMLDRMENTDTEIIEGPIRESKRQKEKL